MVDTLEPLAEAGATGGLSARAIAAALADKPPVAPAKGPLVIVAQTKKPGAVHRPGPRFRMAPLDPGPSCHYTDGGNIGARGIRDLGQAVRPAGWSVCRHAAPPPFPGPVQPHTPEVLKYNIGHQGVKRLLERAITSKPDCCWPLRTVPPPSQALRRSHFSHCSLTWNRLCFPWHLREVRQTGRHAATGGWT